MNARSKLNNHLSVSQDEYNKCVRLIEHGYVINGIKATLRLHHIKFDGNGTPMVKALAEMLYNYIINYCMASRGRHDTLTAPQSAQLVKQARGLFRHPEISTNTPDTTGEAGEILLFVLMEAILKAPQIVAKMELKTNPKDEIKGADGLHAHWHERDQVVDFYFGESKLYQSAADAIASAVSSVEAFHDNDMYKYEFTLMTRHFKLADESVRTAVTDMIQNGEPGENARVNHACLIGYDFKGYQDLDGLSGAELNQRFMELFLKDGERLTKLIQKRFDRFRRKQLRFDVFFVPFPCVSQFRNAFNKALD